MAKNDEGVGAVVEGCGVEVRLGWEAVDWTDGEGTGG